MLEYSDLSEVVSDYEVARNVYVCYTFLATSIAYISRGEWFVRHVCIPPGVGLTTEDGGGTIHLSVKEPLANSEQGLRCFSPLHDLTKIYVLGHCLLLLGPLVRALLEHCSDSLLFVLGTVRFRHVLNAIGGLDLVQVFRNSGFGFVRASGILRHFARNVSRCSSSTRLDCR